jgi:hypothetical protein
MEAKMTADAPSATTELIARLAKARDRFDEAAQLHADIEPELDLLDEVASLLRAQAQQIEAKDALISAFVCQLNEITDTARIALGWEDPGEHTPITIVEVVAASLVAALAQVARLRGAAEEVSGWLERQRKALLKQPTRTGHEQWLVGEYRDRAEELNEALSTPAVQSAEPVGEGR